MGQPPTSLTPLCERLEPRQLLSASPLDVLTYHNDNSRTGAQLHETILKPAGVNAGSFGKLFSIPVDGKVDAEPLYVSGVVMPGLGTHNVLLVATEHDSLYAFDADSGAELWHSSLLGTGEVPSDPRGCEHVTPEIGITATPVIDRNLNGGTIVAVAMSKDSSGQYHQRLHAISLLSGQEQSGSPVEVTATYPGTGDNSQNGSVIFDPAQYKERPALLLSNGIIYTTWASHCDIGAYTGWVIAYSETTLQQTAVLNITPNGSGGAFWGSGGGPAADADGNLFLLGGNGTFDTTLNAAGMPSQGNFGNAFLKVTPGGALSVVDYFTPYNTVGLSSADLDLGSSAPLLLPDMTNARGQTVRLEVGVGKNGQLFVVDRDHMGGFNKGRRSNRNVYQDLGRIFPQGVYATPAYFNGTLYYGGVGDRLKAFRFSPNARLNRTPASRSRRSFGYPGAAPAVSADANANGIVWAVENGDNAVLHAYDASNLRK